MKYVIAALLVVVIIGVLTDSSIPTSKPALDSVAEYQKDFQLKIRGGN